MHVELPPAGAVVEALDLGGQSVMGEVDEVAAVDADEFEGISVPVHSCGSS